MTTLKTLVHTLATTLKSAGADKRRVIGALAAAHHATEEPAADPATKAAAAELVGLASSIDLAFGALAAYINDAHGGSLDVTGGAPVTSATLRLEASFAAHMEPRWLTEMAGAYEAVEDALVEDLAA